jgi:hypothetical protein
MRASIEMRTKREPKIDCARNELEIINERSANFGTNFGSALSFSSKICKVLLQVLKDTSSRAL